MKKAILISLFGLMLGGYASAQTTSSKESHEINTVKRDTNYISAEATVKDWETAYENARILLTREIEDWLIEHGAADVQGAIATCDEHIQEIKTTRGSLFRVFLYVNKNKLYPYVDKAKLVVIDVDRPATQSNAVNIAPTSTIATSSYQMTPEESQMLFIKTFDQIEGYISGLEERGKINDYGKYTSLPTTGTTYIFVYAKDGNVPACLKLEDGKMTNVANGETTDMKTKYAGCGALWFQLK